MLVINKCYSFLLILLFLLGGDILPSVPPSGYYHSLARGSNKLLVEAVWTRFDLVRPFRGWGSNATTPFVYISGSGITTNGPDIKAQSAFGSSVAHLGDLDNDGYDDIAVGASGEHINYGSGDIENAGAVYILFMGPNLSIKSSIRINGKENNGPPVFSNDQFGYSMVCIGDLDGDGVNDLAVGAPGYIVSSVYVLFLQPNGTVRDWRLIRGNYVNLNAPSLNITVNSTQVSDYGEYSGNGPNIRYGSRFGTALANIGDFNKDGTVDLAVSSVDASGGSNAIFLLFLDETATVKGYRRFGPDVGGGPASIPKSFSGYGMSMVMIPDLNNNSIPELVVGASILYEAGSINPNAGEMFVSFLNASGYVNNSQVISETSGQIFGMDRVIPHVPHDECGSALTYIGDINRDQNRQRYPEKMSMEEHRYSVPDFVVGCPQSRSSGLPGRLFFIYLTRFGQIAGFTEIPAESDSFDEVGLELKEFDQFGRALSAFVDVDKNGLKEIIVGAPGDDRAGLNAGAIYILFPRRRRFHPVPFDFLTYILLITIIPCLCCALICSGTVFFYYWFRRIPDEVEIVVKKAGLELDPTKDRPKYEKKPGTVYCDEYIL